MAKLQFVGGKMDKQAVDLKEAKQVIGNRRTAEIPIREAWISWDHAAIHFDAGKFLIEDMASKTGTFVNGTKVAGKVELKEGDKITFGAAPSESVCTFTLAAAAAPAAAAPAAAAPAAAPAPAATPAPAKPATPAPATAAPAAAPAAAAAAAPAAAAGASAAEVNALKDKVASLEINLRSAVRDAKAKDGEIEKLRKDLEAAKGQGKSSETAALEKALEEQAKIIEEKEATIAALEAEKLDLQKAAAVGGARGGGGDTAALDAEIATLKEQLSTAEGEAKQARIESQKAEKALSRKEEEIEKLQGQLAEAKSKGGEEGIGAIATPEDELRSEIEKLNSEIADKNVQLDQLTIENNEFKESVEKLSNRLRDMQEKERGKKSSAESQMEAMEHKVGEYLEAKHAAEKELAEFKKKYAEFEESNMELAARVDDLTERCDVMKMQLEQSDANVGELVRTKVADMQARFDEVTQANQQLKSLIEALEEKVNELDEKAQELEAENTELEKLVDEEKEAHEKTKEESEKQIRALKKRLQLAVSGDATKEPAEATAD